MPDNRVTRVGLDEWLIMEDFGNNGDTVSFLDVYFHCFLLAIIIWWIKIFKIFKKWKGNKFYIHLSFGKMRHSKHYIEAKHKSWKHVPLSGVRYLHFLRRSTLVGEAISFTHDERSLLFINPPCSAAVQWTAIECISEVRRR